MDIEELKKLALAATPGPWRNGNWIERCEKQHSHKGVSGSDPCVYTREFQDGGVYIAAHQNDSPKMVLDCGYDGIEISESDSAYIAAANPQTILALIAENADLRQRCDHIMTEHGKRVDEVARLKVELEEARKDAELYDALRSMHWSDGKLTVIAAKDAGLGVQTYSGNLLDAEIAARQQTSEDADLAQIVSERRNGPTVRVDLKDL